MLFKCTFAMAHYEVMIKIVTFFFVVRFNRQSAHVAETCWYQFALMANKLFKKLRQKEKTYYTHRKQPKSNSL